MINTVLTNVLAAITTMLMILSLIQAFGYRSRANTVYALSLVLLECAFLFYNIPSGLLPSPVPWLIVCMLSAAYFLQTVALRLMLGRTDCWPARFTVYAALCIIAVFFFWVFNLPHYWRSLSASAMISLAAAESLNALYTERTNFRGTLLIPIIVAYLLFLLAHAVRIVLVLVTANTYQEFMGANAVTTGVFILTILFSVLSWGLFSILKTSILMEERDSQRAMLERLALTDKLTGIRNRNALDQILQSEMYAQERYRKNLSAILADIDFFKNVNDTWGHDTGDVVLKETAKRLAASIREADHLFRWGGEEFLIVLPETGLAGAVETAEKVRLAVSAIPIVPVGTVTVSFGAASRDDGETEESWFRRLDRALYLAKQNGRNRVEAAAPAAASGHCLAPEIILGWKKEWDCGNATIDGEHRALVQAGNRLLNRLLDTGSPQALLAEVDSLLEQIAVHFSDEEAILRDAGYPGCDAHCMVHKGLMAAGGLFRDSICQGTGNAESWFHLLVDKIVHEHMLKEDTKFFPYLKK